MRSGGEICLKRRGYCSRFNLLGKSPQRGRIEGMTEKLRQFRRELDELDDQILELLSRRLGICREVALYKAEAGIAMMQADRVTQVKVRAVAEGKTRGLNENFVLSLYEIVITEACRIEDEIIGARERR